jgi:hypothetical protein
VGVVFGHRQKNLFTERQISFLRLLPAIFGSVKSLRTDRNFTTAEQNKQKEQTESNYNEKINEYMKLIKDKKISIFQWMDLIEDDNNNADNILTNVIGILWNTTGKQHAKHPLLREIARWLVYQQIQERNEQAESISCWYPSEYESSVNDEYYKSFCWKTRSDWTRQLQILNKIVLWCRITSLKQNTSISILLTIDNNTPSFYRFNKEKQDWLFSEQQEFKKESKESSSNQEQYIIIQYVSSLTKYYVLTFGYTSVFTENELKSIHLISV